MGDRVNLGSEFGIQCPEQLTFDDTILIIEDQQDMRLIVVHHLQKMGFKNIHQFATGMEALGWLEAHKGAIGVIICAMDMPAMSGIHVLQELKEDPKYQRGPFAMTMSNPSKERIMLATESGVDEILVKPYSLGDIMPKLRNAFKKFHNPYNPEKVYELAKSHFRASKLPEAGHVYERLSQVAEKSARPLVGLARIAVQQKDHKKAMELLKEAEARNKAFVHLYVLRGEIAVARQDFGDAIEQFKKAIELSPLNAMRYEAAAKILFDLDKYQEAVDLLSVALKHELNFPSLHHFLSQGFYALRDYKRAIKHIRSSLNADPENVVYLNQLGIAYKESEMYEDATKVYNSIIKLDPDNKAALYNKAILMKATGNMDEALKILGRILTKYPDFKQAQTKKAEFEKEKASGPAKAG